MFINLNRFKTSSVAKAISSLFLDFTATNTLDDRVTFSRTSNATVTRSDGTIAYAPHNLLTFSEQFDNAAWAKTQSSVTANTSIAPDGTLTADTIIPNTVSAAHSCNQSLSVTSGVAYTLTFYAKAAGYNFSGILFAAAGFGTATNDIFDLINGTVAINASGTATITSVGNGWYRCSASRTATATAATPFQIRVNQTGGGVNYVGDGTSGIYVWGAQLEQSSTATTYNPTTVKNLLGFSELFDNAAWTKSNSFMQTNLLTYSEAFDNAAWTAARVTFSANSAIAPNGYQTADKLIETATTGLHNVQQILTVTSGAAYTLSIYAKAAERTILEVIDPYTLTGATFDLVNGTTGNPQTGGVTLATNRGIEPAANGFYRCYFRVTTAGTSLAMRAGLSDGSATSYAGNGTSGLIYWGAQLVQGAVAGDYRRTDAAALPVYYPNHNGVVVAEQLHGTSANGTVLESYTASGGSMTFSIWMRRITGTGNVDITMDTGTTWTTQAITTSWARYSITSTPASGARTAGVRLVTSGDIIQIFGAQLSDSASLDPYVLNIAAAPTAAAYYGPRFDYDPVTLQPKGLLIEEQRANLVLQSGFAGAVAGTPGTAPTSWTLAVSGGTTNTLISDGLGGNIISYSTVAARQFLTQSISVSANTTYTASVYINSNTGAVYSSIFAIAALPAGATVTYYANGVAVTVASYIPLAGDRLTAIIVISATAGTVTPRIGIGAGANDTGTVSFSKIQLEAGAFATSYIPTVASQVTRTVDVATIQGSNFYSWYNQNEGTVYCSVNVVTAQSTNLFEIAGSSGSDYITADYNNGVTSQFRTLIRSNGTFEVNQNNGSAKTTGTQKYALAYKTNDTAFSVSGDTSITDSSVLLPITSTITFAGKPVGVGATAYGTTTIQKFAYYPIRLSNEVLQGLTK